MQSFNLNNNSQLISETISRVLLERRLAVLVTIVEAPPDMDCVGAKLLLDESGMRAGSFGASERDAFEDAVSAHAATFLHANEQTKIFQVRDFAPELSEWADAKLLFERLQPEPRLVICGAGHVGAALARIASLLGYHTILIDDRREFLSPERFSETGIELVKAGDWAEAVRLAVGAGKGVSVAIVTRGHSEDEECLRAVIDLNADYVGLIGSKRRTNIVLQRLRESGAAAEAINLVHAPVGLDIGAVTPEEVALAIMAEVVAVRRGGKGESLSKRRQGK
jgi:xanthine dehydrogenase accessory factor